MVKADSVVRQETKYIAYFSVVLSVLMQAVFLLLGKWDLSVLLGNILSTALMVGNFYFLGLSVQKAVATGDEKESKKIMKNSQSLRTLVMFIVVMLGAWIPAFSTIAIIIPLFFTRIAIAFRPLWEKGINRRRSLDNEAE